MEHVGVGRGEGQEQGRGGWWECVDGARDNKGVRERGEGSGRLGREKNGGGGEEGVKGGTGWRGAEGGERRKETWEG